MLEDLVVRAVELDLGQITDCQNPTNLISLEKYPLGLFVSRDPQIIYDHLLK